MNLLRNCFLIDADADSNSQIQIKGLNDELLILDTKFEKYRNAVQFGSILSCPLSLSEKSIDSHLLKPSDKVVFHHFVVQENNKWLIDGKTYYKAIWEHIWGKIENNTIIPINDWVFIEPIIETEEELFCHGLKLKEYQEPVPQSGIVYAPSPYCESLGIHKGDKVHYVKQANYDITIGEKELYRMKARAILVIDDSDELFPQTGNVLVQQDELPTHVFRNGIKLPEEMRNRQLTGKIIRDNSSQFSVGQKISYLRGQFGNFNLNDINYSILEPRHILYVE